MMQSPSSPRKRPYLLMAEDRSAMLAAGEPRQWAEDPGASLRFAVQAAWVEALPAIAFAPAAPEPAFEAPAPMPSIEVEHESAPVSFDTPPPVFESAPAFEGDSFAADPLAAEQSLEPSEREPQPMDVPRRSSLHELAAAVVPSVVGAGLAWFLAGETGADPITWTALGAAAGFLLGWGCLLWIRREG